MIKYLVVLFVGLVGCDNSSESSNNVFQIKSIILADQSNYDSTEWARGEYNVQSALLQGDILTLNISCSGSSAKDFELVVWNYFLESYPVQAHALLSIKADTVGSEYSNHMLSYNLSPLKAKYKEIYGSASSKISLRLRYLETEKVSLLYEF